MAFDPSDPYSSAMDNIPLKDLFPNVKVRKRAHGKKTEPSDVPSLGTVENQESVRSKLRESLTSALSLKTDPEADSKVEHKRMKMEAEMTRDEENSKSEEKAEKVAIAIEAELFLYFGGVNRKYKEKARSLLFNLKDRSNPELRLRVISGEISPQHLCTMNAEQLASKELSQWRQAKAEEFAHMVVLPEGDTDQVRLVKKTHKGDILFTEVKDEKDDVLSEVVTAGAQQRIASAMKQNKEEADVHGPNETTFNDETHSLLSEADTEQLSFSPIRDQDTTMTSAADNQVHIASPIYDDDQEELLDAAAESNLNNDKDARLPAIMSLDEYLGSKKERGAKSVVRDDEIENKSGNNRVKTETPNPSLVSSRDKVLRVPAGSPKPRALDSGNSKSASSLKEKKKEYRKGEKLWEGSLQLSGSLISPVLALYKSGDAVELQSWPKLIEIKGRVRLDALEKFLQELHLSRTRSVMIIACRVDAQGDNGVSINTLKEAASQYQKGERVGYAEPVPGFELYLFPGGGTSLKLLVEHGYLNADQILAEEQGILVGFLVCRKSVIPMNLTHKTSSQYFTANRHALSAQLDSPTRPSETQWAGNAAKLPISSSGITSRSDLEDKKPTLFLASTQSNIVMPDGKVDPTTSNSVSNGPQLMTQNALLPDVAGSMHIPQDPRAVMHPKPSADCSMKESIQEEDLGDDLPPGFAPKSMTSVKPGVGLINSQNDDDDDDDLPEFDFASQTTVSLAPTSVRLPEVAGVSPSSLPASMGMQPSFPQGPVFPQPLQSPQLMVSSEHNPAGHILSQFSRPALPLSQGPMEQVNPNLHLPQMPQQSHFPALPRPPPGPVPSVQQFNFFPPRPPGIPGDRMVIARPPMNHSQMPGSGLHGDRLDAFMNQPATNQPILPRPFGNPPRPEQLPSNLEEQRARSEPTLSSQQNFQPLPQNFSTSKDTARTQASSIWDDDDDMPEWCPPALVQPDNRQQGPLLLSTVPPAGGHQGVLELGRPPHPQGRGWQGGPRSMAPELRRPAPPADGRGILQAPRPPSTMPPPPPPLRFPPPRGGAPMGTRPEQVLGGQLSSRQANHRESKRVK